MDKINFVIFVIMPLSLEFQVDKTTRIRLPALFKPAAYYGSGYAIKVMREHMEKAMPLDGKDRTLL